MSSIIEQLEFANIYKRLRKVTIVASYHRIMMDNCRFVLQTERQ
ncbi:MULTISPECIES: hypothetical protein [unclassified Psychrobacter]|nr:MULTISPECIES: hypothetical protein [unclassified Psychrobacter]